MDPKRQKEILKLALDSLWALMFPSDDATVPRVVERMKALKVSTTDLHDLQRILAPLLEQPTDELVLEQPTDELVVEREQYAKTVGLKGRAFRIFCALLSSSERESREFSRAEVIRGIIGESYTLAKAFNNFKPLSHTGHGHQPFGAARRDIASAKHYGPLGGP